MMTYLLLDLVFIGTIILCDTVVFKTNVWRLKETWITFLIILMFTLIFNTILTSLPIVTYDYTKLLGIYLGSFPVEDLAYTLAVALLIPLLRRVLRAS
jgi:small toxic polypeptide LdrA/B/C/D